MWRAFYPVVEERAASGNPVIHSSTMCKIIAILVASMLLFSCSDSEPSAVEQVEQVEQVVQETEPEAQDADQVSEETLQLLEELGY